MRAAYILHTVGERRRRRASSTVLGGRCSALLRCSAVDVESGDMDEVRSAECNASGVFVT